MGNFDDLYKALGTFQEGAKNLAITQGINDATAQVDALNQQNMSLLQKRQAQQSLAQNLALQLTKAGASQSQIQTAFGAVAPPAIKDANEAYQQAVATGDQEMLGMAKGMQQFERHNQEFLQNDQQEFLGGEGDKNRANAYQIASMRTDAQASKGLKPVPTAVANKLIAQEDAIMATRDLLAEFKSLGMDKQIGPIAGLDIIKSWRNPEFGNYKAKVGRYFDQYRKAITGAGAGAQEIKMLQKNMPDMQDTPELFESKLKALEDLAVKVRNNNVKRYSQMRYDLGETEMMSSMLQDAPGASALGTPAVVRDKVTKQIIRGYKDAEGNFTPAADVAAGLDSVGQQAASPGDMINTGMTVPKKTKKK